MSTFSVRDSSCKGICNPNLHHRSAATQRLPVPSLLSTGSTVSVFQSSERGMKEDWQKAGHRQPCVALPWHLGQRWRCSQGAPWSSRIAPLQKLRIRAANRILHSTHRHTSGRKQKEASGIFHSDEFSGICLHLVGSFYEMTAKTPEWLPLRRTGWHQQDTLQAAVAMPVPSVRLSPAWDHGSPHLGYCTTLPRRTKIERGWEEMLTQIFIIQKLMVSTLNTLSFLLSLNKGRDSGVVVYSKRHK